MAAALEASSRTRGSVYVLESMSKVGGNSAKASSGMNGCYTPYQESQNVADSLELFKGDTQKMARDMADPALIEKLVDESADAISFVSGLGLPLRDVIQLGGHSAARTHRLEGMPIGAALMKTMAAEATKRDNIRVITEAVVSRMCLEDCPDDDGGTGRRVTGVAFTQAGGEETELSAGAVVLTTGGAACDVEPDGLMQEYAPHLMGKATSSGAQATGKGIKLAKAAGVELVNMHRVQLHPTGFIDPSNPESTSKFLAPEALRGSGGILLSQEGDRFANELGSRSYLTDCIHQHCQPFGVDLSTGQSQTSAFMFLSAEAAKKFGAGPMGFYVSKGLFREFNGLREACEALDLPIDNVEKSIRDYAVFASGDTSDPFGKVTFPTVFDVGADSKLYVALVTPVIHYSLGGIKIDVKSRALLQSTQEGVPSPPLKGLYAAGECTGGVHGFDRLGGNSLLECIVFGRTAGIEAATSIN